MHFGGSGYFLVTVVGGFLLLAAIIWATLRNRNMKGFENTERATRELRAQLNEEDTGIKRDR